jgi:hypothetical protein
MSQSDYIRYKRLHNEMSEWTKIPIKVTPILDYGKYISYKEYSLENTIVSNNTAYDKYVPPETPIVFGMVKRCTEATQPFILCANTNTRANRVPAGLSKLFQYPDMKDISKAKRMKWNSIADTTMCNCNV